VLGEEGPVITDGRPHNAWQSQGNTERFKVHLDGAGLMNATGSPAGSWRCGMGAATNSRRERRASHRARRAERSTRALSVAMPVFAYI
jgi:hypothetical protein